MAKGMLWMRKMDTVGADRPTRPRDFYGADVLRLVNTASATELLERVSSLLAREKGFAVATLNLDHVVKLRASPRFRDAYAQQSFVVADGNPIVWLSRLAGDVIDLVPGSELIKPMAALATEKGIMVAMIGSTETSLQAAMDQLMTEYSGLQIVLCLAPPHGFDPDSAAAEEILTQVSASGARLCFVALGAPKQEIFAARGLDMVPGCGFVSIGAGLDFISGHQKRAPIWVQKIAMEWLWRMMTNPMRLAMRYFKCFLILPGLALDAWRLRMSK